MLTVLDQFLKEGDLSRSQQALAAILADESGRISNRLADRVEFLPLQLRRQCPDTPSLVESAKRLLGQLLQDFRSEYLESIRKGEKNPKSPNLDRLTDRATDEVWSRLARSGWSERFALDSRIRRGIESATGINIWVDRRGVELVGFSNWADRAPASGPKLQQLKDKPTSTLDTNGLNKANPVQSVDAILDWLGGPVSLALVSNAIASRRLQNKVDESETASYDRMSNSQPGEDLEVLWQSLQSMDDGLRKAFLLSPRDGQILEQFLLSGIRIEDLAQSMGFKSPTDWYPVYQQIPLGPSEVAKHLSVSEPIARKMIEMGRRQVAEAHKTWNQTRAGGGR